MDLNNIIDLMDLTNIHRMFHPIAAEYIFSSSAHRTFSKIQHRPKTSHNKFKKTEIIPSIFSNHNERKLEISQIYEN